MHVARPLLVMSLAAAACGDDGNTQKDAAVDMPADMAIDVPDGKGPCPVGDTTLPIEIEPGYFHPNTGAFTPLLEMMQAPITDSQQGFWVVRIGVRARNIDACTQYMLTVALRDTCANQLLKVESRTLIFQDMHDGWAVPYNLSYYSSLHACPYPSPTRDISGQPYTLEVILEEASTGRRAERSLHFVPTCQADSSELARCLCECDRDYVIGGSCPPATDTGPGPVCNP